MAVKNAADVCSRLRNRDLADRSDGRRANLEAWPQELVDGVHVVGLDDEKQRVLSVGAVPADELDALHVRIEE